MLSFGVRGSAAACALLLVFSGVIRSQETRGTIYGTVRDGTGAVVPGALVEIANVGTNVASSLRTNEEGYFSFPYLSPGAYRVAVSAQGFKSHVQQNVRVNAEGRASLEIVLEVGAVADQVTVTADAVLVDSASATGATVLDSNQISNLPLYGSNAQMLAAIAPGVQIGRPFTNVAAHDIRPQVAVSVAGGIGFPEFAIDGIANRNERGRISYAPHTDTVEEVKVDTANFDASQGHTSNIRVSLITKSGTNDFHGTLNWQHWQSKWNAVPSLAKAQRAQAISQALAAGNATEANRLGSTRIVPAGRSNVYGATLGGPVTIPRLFNGRNRLFFFFGVNGYDERKTTENFYTVPTAEQRRGDFSNLLRIPNPIVIYDPRTARLQGSTVVRDPFPNNQVPTFNPMYEHYAKYYPLPNNSPRETVEGINNYHASQIPQIWDFRTYTSRVDYFISPRHKTFGRWHWSNFDEDTGDWAYEVVRGLSADRFQRRNWGALADYVFTVDANTILTFAGAYSHYNDGNYQTDLQLGFRPSSVGLPSYLDERAGELNVIPRVGIDGYATITPGRRSGYNRYTIALYRGELARTWRSHSMKLGFDVRDLRRSEFFPSNSAGNFNFGREWTRRTDLASSANIDVGLSWAAFMLGLPRNSGGIVYPTRTPADRSNFAFSFYMQDDWKIAPRLTLNLGLRFERETGAREVQNRFLNYFNVASALPISEAAEAAYLRNPLPEVPRIQVRGGSAYAGVDGAPEYLTPPESMIMPRVGAVYQLTRNTVVRAGYGMFFESLSALDFDADSRGFSRDTTIAISDDNGLTFKNADLARGVTPLSDPFPRRPDGTRFNEPLGSVIGLLATAGRSASFSGDNWRRARQQRWRVGLQQSLFGHTVVEAAYLGSRADRLIVSKPLNAMPEQFYITGMNRNVAAENELNRNITPNPFHISNFASLQQSSVEQYNELLGQGFFTGNAVRKNQLLRPFPHMTGLTDTNLSAGESAYHHLELSANLRLSLFRGITSYTWASDRRRTTYNNEFDDVLMWLPSNTSRPHLFKAHGILDLPFGRGRSWLNRGLAASILGGWQLGAGYIYQSGEFVGFGNVFYYGNDLNDILLADPTPGRWFNTANFELDRNRIPSAFHVRVFPRDFGFRSDAAHSLDANVMKEFPIGETARLQFRGDFLNALNTVQWAAPSVDPTNSNFGQSTAIRNSPRLIQAGVRIQF